MGWIICDGSEELIRDIEAMQIDGWGPQPLLQTTKHQVKKLFLDDAKLEKQLEALVRIAKVMDKECGMNGTEEIERHWESLLPAQTSVETTDAILPDDQPIDSATRIKEQKLDWKFDVLNYYLHSCHFYNPWGVETSGPEDQQRRGGIYIRVMNSTSYYTNNEDQEKPTGETIFANSEMEKPDLVYYTKLLGITKFMHPGVQRYIHNGDQNNESAQENVGEDDMKLNPLLQFPESDLLSVDIMKALKRYLMQIGYKEYSHELEKAMGIRIRKEGEGKYR
jgi:hypothetical protein